VTVYGVLLGDEVTVYGVLLGDEVTVYGVLLGDEVTVYGVLPGDEVTVYGVLLGDDVTVYGVLPGDEVTVYGVMCQRWKPLYDGARCDVELVLKANNIEVNNHQAAAAGLMKDVQEEFEDFWKHYRYDPIAGGEE